MAHAGGYWVYKVVEWATVIADGSQLVNQHTAMDDGLTHREVDDQY